MKSGVEEWHTLISHVDEFGCGTRGYIHVKEQFETTAIRYLGGGLGGGIAGRRVEIGVFMRKVTCNGFWEFVNWNINAYYKYSTKWLEINNIDNSPDILFHRMHICNGNFIILKF